jgi:hypothetical protein
MTTLPAAVVALLAAAVPTGPRAAAPPENLLRGPARCVLRYLEAVRLAGPRAAEVRTPRAIPVREADYAAAKAFVAPRSLEALARNDDHPLALWREAARGGVLESFQLLAVRRAPRAAAIVTVRERWWRPGRADDALARSVSEYLVARVDGDWKVIDRRAGGGFADADVAGAYGRWFDAPPAPPGPGVVSSDAAPSPAVATPSDLAPAAGAPVR